MRMPNVSRMRLLGARVVLTPKAEKGVGMYNKAVELAEAHGWRGPFAVASVWCAVASLAVFTFYRAPHDLPSVAAGRVGSLLPREWGLIVLAGIAWGAFNAGYVVYLSFGPSMLEAQGMASEP